MNSMSKCHDNHDNCRKEKDLCPTIIKCSQAGSVTVPPATVLGTAFPLTALTLDTSCLKNPCVKLEFASNLVAAVAFTGTINFQVFKVCRNQSTPVPVGPAYTFNCDECCTYTVTATITSAVTVGTLSINNATLGAIAACGSSSCC
jgi:hypothetical protein